MRFCLLSILALAGALSFTFGSTARAEGWGTIKGQVVYDGKEAPQRAPVDVTKDRAACLKNGPLLEDKLIVNPKNKGVRWCVVYLMHDEGFLKGFKKDIPIHPKLQAIKNLNVEMDQPCCQFEPHVIALREGQTVIFKNSATVAHNVNVVNVGLGPAPNQIVPAKGQFQVQDLKARNIPIMVKCDIHPWMKGWVAVLKHPYFAVTDENGNFEIKDAPAGNFRLVVWQEETGWVIGDNGKPSRDGKKIAIKAGDTTDLGKIPLKPSER